MTVDEQLQMWVAGNPVHNPTRDECCPDFSCCQPQLLAPADVRERFAAGNETDRHSMLMMFLSAGIAEMTPKRVAIAGDGTENGVQ